MEVVTKPEPSMASNDAVKDTTLITTISATPSHVKSKHLSQDSYASTASWNTIDLEKAAPLREKRNSKIIRNTRHTWFNVYRRLFSFVFLLNLIGLAALLAVNNKWLTSPPLAILADCAAGNIMVALLARQDYMVNLFFRFTWLVPVSAPLKLRCMLAKVYEYGGVHSGCAVSSVMWYSLLTAFLTNEFVQGRLRDVPTPTFTFILIVILIALCITAYPRFRFKSHNTFENVHRWGGWFALALFWVELVLFSRSQQIASGTSSIGSILIKLPATWFLLVSSLHAIYPWLRFHKMYIRPEKLSDHAIRLHFSEPIPTFVGLRISHAPLKEWHSFAAIPSRDGGKSGGSVLISNAGDWTQSTIQNPRPYYYVKGVPVTGVLCMAQIFKSVVIVTTGSGIGPCLGVMQDIPNTKVRVIWSTPSPLKTYGEEIVGMVRETDPRAVIWDTRAQGRPDLVRLAWAAYLEEGAEAIFVISNPKLTRKVVYGMESRGVPAFGPIWDS